MRARGHPPEDENQACTLCLFRSLVRVAEIIHEIACLDWITMATLFKDSKRMTAGRMAADIGRLHFENIVANRPCLERGSIYLAISTPYVSPIIKMIISS